MGVYERGGRGRREQVRKILLKQNIFVFSLIFTEAFPQIYPSHSKPNLESLRKTTPNEIMYSHTIAKISVV